MSFKNTLIETPRIFFFTKYLGLGKLTKLMIIGRKVQLCIGVGLSLHVKVELGGLCWKAVRMLRSRTPHTGRWVLSHMSPSPSHGGATTLDQEACVNIYYSKNQAEGLWSQKGL